MTRPPPHSRGGLAWEIGKIALGGSIPLLGFLLGFYRNLVFTPDLDLKLKEHEGRVTGSVQSQVAALEKTLDGLTTRVTALGDGLQYLRGRMKEGSQ